MMLSVCPSACWSKRLSSGCLRQRRNLPIVLSSLTRRYKDPQEEEKITADGMFKFLEDLGLNPESQVVLIIAWKFKAATQCEFTRDEFVTGMTDVGCDSIDRLKAKVGY